MVVQLKTRPSGRVFFWALLEKQPDHREIISQSQIEAAVKIGETERPVTLLKVKGKPLLTRYLIYHHLRAGNLFRKLLATAG